MATNRLTGKQASLTIDGNDVKLTKATAKSTKEPADVTDSGDYDAASDLIHRTFENHTISSEISVEGKVRTASPTTLSALLAKCYNGDAELTGNLKLNGSITILTGSWNVVDFEADVPIDNAVTFKATLKSNGIITPGS